MNNSEDFLECQGIHLRICWFYLKRCEELSTKSYGRRTPITVWKQLMITLWYLGGLDPVIRIADRFGVSESSIIICRNRVMIALPKNISWPTGEKVQSVITKFSERNNFPVIIGALDDTHINIRAPDDHPQSYANGKQIHSLHLKAVCKWNSNIVMLAFLAAAMMPEFCANQTYRTVAWYFAMVIILLLMGHILCVDGC